MSSDIVNKNTSFQPSKKIILRRKGFFFFLGTIAFTIQWLFSLGDTITWILFAGLEFIYTFAFPEKESKGQLQASLRKEILQVAIKLTWLLIIFLAISLVWIWVWRITGIPFSILAAITSALVGLVLVIRSFTILSDE